MSTAAGTAGRTPFPSGRAGWRTLWDEWSVAGPIKAPARTVWPRELRWARFTAILLLLIQLVVLLWWCRRLTDRFALTFDFGSWEQAVYLIAHGHLDPYSTTLGHAFWRDHAEFLAWPLALLELVWPHPETIMWAQAAAAVGCELVALTWMCELAARSAERGRTRGVPAALVVAGVSLLAVNPWVVWACSYDVHLEAFAALFLLLAARDLFHGRRRVWVWVALGLASGDVSATYMAGLGISAVLMGRRFLRVGLVVAILGVTYLFFLGLIHGSMGSSAGNYANVLGNSGTLPQSGSAVSVGLALVRHPLRAARAILENRTNEWANVAPSGVLGWFWLPVMIPCAIVLLEGGLSHGGENFSLPGFQNLAVVPLTTVGTIALIAALAARPSRARQRVAVGLSALIIFNAVIWAVVFLPQVSPTWLRVSPAAARVLAETRNRIPNSDEVVVSQGEAGGFAARQFIYPVMSPTMTVRVRTRPVWFVLTPRQGIETASVAGQEADLKQLADTPDVRLIRHAAGVWVFEWSPARGVTSLHLGSNAATVPAWAVAGPGATPVLRGPQADWYVTSDGRPGYVVDHAYWRETRGTYRARVLLAASTSANVEVWNDTTGTLLSRTTVPSTNGKTTVTSVVTLARDPPEHEDDGWGIWRMALTPPTGDQLEIRVYSPGGNDEVSVYSVGLVKLSA